MGVAPPGLGLDAGELLVQPALDLGRVALPGLGLRPLGASVQPVLEDLADVLGVEADAEVALDEGRDALGGPQGIGPAVGGGACEQEAFQVGELVVVEAGGRPGVGPGGEAVGLCAGRLVPAVGRAACPTEDAGDEGRGFALFHKFDGVAAAAFEFCGGSERSAHTKLDAP